MLSTAHPPLAAELCQYGCLGFWTLAYLLIIKRGFQDRTFGMPLSALCANLAWEGLLEFHFEPPDRSWKIGYLAWFIPNLVILYTALRWGREDFTHRLIRRYFYGLIALGILLALYTEWSFMTFYRDPYGVILGWILDVIIGGLLIAMLLRRGTVRGQSVYIALCILLGNGCGYVQNLYLPMPPPSFPLEMVHPLVVCTFALNIGYLILLWDQCRLAGLNPWERI